MKTESTSKKNVLQMEHYAAMTAAFLATAGTAQAGIIYTDLDPDETAVNSEVLIDMDGDGVWDFRAEQAGYSTGGPSFFFANHITRLRGNTVSGPSYGWVNNGATFLAGALSAGASIGPASPITSSTWATVGAYRIFTSSGGYSSGSSRGSWLGENDKYLGVYFNMPDGIHYGWIRASVTVRANSFTVKDWAYEDQVGVPIAAGDMGGCNTATAPQNPISTNGATKVTLSWDAVSGSVACQVQGNQLVPPGPSPKANKSGSEVTSFDVPYAVAGAGTTWSWQVRCACSISPLEVTPFSVLDTFSVPILREETDLPAVEVADLYPNPTSDRARLDISEPVSRDTEVRISDLLGRAVDFIILPANARNIDLDLSALEAGIYFVQVGDLDTLPIEVVR